MYLFGLIAGVITGFPLVPLFKSNNNENLDGGQSSDKNLRIGGAVIYGILSLVFLGLILFKN